jgi:hypothetical protein
MFGSLGVLLVVAATLAAWSISEADVFGIGRSPLASDKDRGGPSQSSEFEEQQSTSSGEVFVTDYLNSPLSEPATLVYGNHLRLVEIRWAGWGQDPVEGSGVVETVDCVPNCAEGASVEEPVEIQLSKLELCDGKSLYTNMHIEGEHSGGDYPMPCSPAE